MTKQRIIFLDIDGVICTRRAFMAQGMRPDEHHRMRAYDREGIGLLNALHDISPGNTSFVLTSTWREQCTKQHMWDLLNAYGWEGYWSSLGWKLEAGPEASRGSLIEQWLTANHDQFERFVILDDHDNFPETMKPAWVRTSENNGIMWEHFQQAAKILHGVIIPS